MAAILLYVTFNTVSAPMPSHDVLAVQAVASANKQEVDVEESPEVLSNGAVEKAVRRSFPEHHIMVDIARCESKFRMWDTQKQQVLRGIVNSKDVGIFQINEKYHLEDALKKGYDIYTVEGNIAYARKLHASQGTGPWEASRYCWAR